MSKKEETVKGNVFSKDFVEGLIAECIAQIKESLDLLQHGNGIEGVKRLDSVKGTYLIAINEANNIITMLQHYSDAALSPKHKLSRYVLRSFVRKLQDIDGFMEAKRMDNTRIVAFARVITEFLVAIHMVMHSDSEQKTREFHVASFCGDDLDTYGSNIAKVITVH